ncbi:MAG: hypothetical protein ACXV2H_04190 [Actinomycetes bacterium]
MSAPPETIHERGRAALLAGETQYDVPPGPHSPRWGISAILRPDPAAESQLADLATEASALAGPHQWQTGSAGASHLTLSAFEPYREGVQDDDPVLLTYARALDRVAAGSGPLGWRLGGVALADRGVLVLATPLDDRPDAFRAAVLAELGAHGRGDHAYRRSVWWATALHFAGPVARPRALLDWAEARREQDLGTFTASAVELVRYEHRLDIVGARTVPVTLRRHPLTGRG